VTPVKCQSCQKKKATVHLTEIGSKMKKEIHLCDECAKEHDAILPHSVGSQAETTGDGVTHPLAEGLSKDEVVGTCRSCGMSFAEFRSTGRLGCPEDYEVFRRGLNPILERIHGGRQHRGKVPPQVGEAAMVEREIMKLTERLERAVKDEKYEEAARIRDQIQELRETSLADH
jgi:protein arginine kinase activator